MKWLTSRRVSKWESARVWAEAMNEQINRLPQHLQDQIDGRIRDTVDPALVRKARRHAAGGEA